MISLIFQNGDKTIARGAVETVHEIPPEQETICLLDDERHMEREFRVLDVKRKYVLNRLPGSRQIILEAVVYVESHRAYPTIPDVNEPISTYEVESELPVTTALPESRPENNFSGDKEARMKRGRNARR